MMIVVSVLSSRRAALLDAARFTEPMKDARSPNTLRTSSTRSSFTSFAARTMVQPAPAPRPATNTGTRFVRAGNSGVGAQAKCRMSRAPRDAYGTCKEWSDPPCVRLVDLLEGWCRNSDEPNDVLAHLLPCERLYWKDVRRTIHRRTAQPVTAQAVALPPKLASEGAGPRLRPLTMADLEPAKLCSSHEERWAWFTYLVQLVSQCRAEMAYVEHQMSWLRVRNDNPAAGVAKPDRGARKGKQWLFPNEHAKLMSCKAVPLHWRELYAITTYLYLRPGEAFGLEWAAVQIDAGYVQVSQALDLSTGETKPTKTTAGRRVPIHAHLKPLLQRMGDDAKWTGRVIDGAKLPAQSKLNGIPEKLSTPLRDHLRLAQVERADLFDDSNTTKNLTFYDLRGTGITWEALAGTEPMRMMQRAGHTTFTTTLGYIREAEAIGVDVGAPFPPLPSELTGDSGKTSDRVLVHHAVAGGFAVVLHGVAAHDLRSGHRDRRCRREHEAAGLEREGFGPRLPVPLHELADASARSRWIAERDLIAFTVTQKLSAEERFHWLVDTLALCYELATPEVRAQWREHKRR